MDTHYILKWLIFIMLIFSITMVAFGTGIWVGQKRAEYSFRWAENYHRNFGGPKEGFFGNFPEKDFINGHGVYGPIMEINGNILLALGQDGMEKPVLVQPDTIVRSRAGELRPEDIKVGDVAVIIGAPNAYGQIEAELIRIVPE